MTRIHLTINMEAQNFRSAFKVSKTIWPLLATEQTTIKLKRPSYNSQRRKD